MRESQQRRRHAERSDSEAAAATRKIGHQGRGEWLRQAARRDAQADSESASPTCCWRLTAPIARQAILRRRGVACRRAVSGGREARPLHSTGAVTVGQSQRATAVGGTTGGSARMQQSPVCQSTSREDDGRTIGSLIGRPLSVRSRWNGAADPVRQPAEPLRLQTRQSVRASAGHLQAWRAVQRSTHRSSSSHRTYDCRPGADVDGCRERDAPSWAAVSGWLRSPVSWPRRWAKAAPSQLTNTTASVSGSAGRMPTLTSTPLTVRCRCLFRPAHLHFATSAPLHRADTDTAQLRPVPNAAPTIDSAQCPRRR